MKKDVGMAKCFPKKKQGMSFQLPACNPKVMSRCLSAPDATSLHPEPLLTLSTHAREGYSSHFVCQSVCHFFIVEGCGFSGLKLTSVHSR